MIKNKSDVNDKLMDLNKKQKDMNKKEEPKQMVNQTTKNLYLTTADLQKMMNNEDEKLIDVTPTE